MKKRTCVSLCMPLVILSVYLMAGLSPGGGSDCTPEAIAVVNGSVIPRGMLDREMHDIKTRYAEAKKDVSDLKLLEIKTRMTDQLIDNELLYQESQRKKIKVDETSVQAKFGLIRGGFADEDEFNQWLEEMSLSQEVLMDQIRRQAAINQLISELISKKVTASEKEAKDYYKKHGDFFKRPESVRVSHILIRVESEPKEENKAQALKTLKEIQAKLEKGEDFSVLAKTYSEDQSKHNGGDLGYLIPGLMPTALETTAFGLEPGKVSDIVETEQGYHVIKVTDKKPETTLSFEEARKQVEQYVIHEKTQKELTEYVAGLRQKANIVRCAVGAAQ